MPPKGTEQKIVRIGHYKLDKRLGRGGMGTVYLARDEKFDRQVALKVLAPKLSTNERYVGRFMREAKAAAALHHPNIVSAIDFGHDGEFYYFAMEYIDGEMLKRILKRSGPFDESEALRICELVAHALAHAVRQSIIHRDIKPENIMLSRTGEVKLTDMGLAKSIEDPDATITQAGQMIGTPHYASPEQLRGLTDIDGRTDIYSLGITVWHLLVGRPPFEGETTAVITLKQLNEELPPLREERPEISENMAHLVWKMTRKDPKDRYQTPDELLEDIRRMKAGENLTGSPVRKLKRRTGATGKHAESLHRSPKFNPVPVGIGAASLLIILLAISLLRTEAPEQPEVPLDSPPAQTGRPLEDPSQPEKLPAIKNTAPIQPPRSTGIKKLPVPGKTASPLRNATKRMKKPAETKKPAVDIEERLVEVRMKKLEQEISRFLDVNDLKSAFDLLQEREDGEKGLEMKAAIQERKEQVLGLAKRTLEELQTSTTAALQRNRWQEMEKELLLYRGRLPGELGQTLEGLIQKVRRWKQQYAEARKKFQAVEKAVTADIANRKYGKAEALLEETRQQLTFPEFAQRIEELGQQLSLINKAWDGIVDTLNRMKGIPYRIKDVAANISSANRKGLTMVSGPAVVFFYPMEQIPLTKILDVMNSRSRRTSDISTLAGLVWLAYYEGQFKKSLPKLRRLSDDKAFVVLLKELEVYRMGNPEETAGKLWAEIAARAKEGKFRNLAAKLDIFENVCGQTNFYQRHQSAVQALRADLVEWAKPNYVLRFDGQRTSVSASKPVPLRDGSLTFEVWIQTKARNSAPILTIQAYDHVLLLTVDGPTGYPRFFIQPGQQPIVQMNGTSAVNDGSPHYLAGILEVGRSKATLIVDGEVVAEKPCTSEGGPSLDYVAIGYGPADREKVKTPVRMPFIGDIDEVRIWSYRRALRELQNKRFQRLSGREPGLVCYWNFDQKGRDWGAHGNDLSLADPAALVQQPWNHFRFQDAVARAPDRPPRSSAPATSSSRTITRSHPPSKEIASLFHGHIEGLPNGRIRLDYSFDDMAESKDWFSLYNGFEIRRSRLYSFGAEMRHWIWHKARFEDDVAIEYVAAGSDEINGILQGNSMLTPRRRKGVVFRIGARRDDSLRVEFYGPGSTFGWTGNYRVQTSSDHRVRASITGQRVELHVDGKSFLKKEFDRGNFSGTGLAGLYSTGRGTSWDRVTIEGRLNRIWLKQELARARARSSRTNYALRFDGRGGYVLLPALMVKMNKRLTWEGWFYIEKQGATDLISSGSKREGCGLQLTALGEISFFLNSGRSYRSVDAAPSATPWKRWAHIAVCFDGSVLTLFINGNRVAYENWQGATFPKYYPIKLGDGPERSSFSGMMEEVRFSNDRRYRRRFRPIKKLESDNSTVALYHFDEGTGNTLHEASSRIIGASVNGPSWFRHK